jgi:hypothetical protein
LAVLFFVGYQRLCLFPKIVGYFPGMFLFHVYPLLFMFRRVFLNYFGTCSKEGLRAAGIGDGDGELKWYPEAFLGRREE